MWGKKGGAWAWSAVACCVVYVTPDSLMDKASASGAGGSRFKAWAGRPVWDFGVAAHTSYSKRVLNLQSSNMIYPLWTTQRSAMVMPIGSVNLPTHGRTGNFTQGLPNANRL